MASTLPNALDCCNAPCSDVPFTVECPGDCAPLVAVPTTAALRALPSASFVLYQRMDRLGDVFASDGFGMTYWWNSASFDADNGTSIIKPDDIDPGDPGRWIQWS